MGNIKELDEIQDLNLSYLMVAQRMLKNDYATALFRLNITEEAAQLLLSMSTKKLGQLARTNQFLFRFAFENPEALRQLAFDQREQGLEGIHAALLEASAQPADELESAHGEA